GTRVTLNGVVSSAPSTTEVVRASGRSVVELVVRLVLGHVRVGGTVPVRCTGFTDRNTVGLHRPGDLVAQLGKHRIQHVTGAGGGAEVPVAQDRALRVEPVGTAQPRQ